MDKNGNGMEKDTKIINIDMYISPKYTAQRWEGISIMGYEILSS